MSKRTTYTVPEVNVQPTFIKGKPSGKFRFDLLADELSEGFRPGLYKLTLKKIPKEGVE